MFDAHIQFYAYDNTEGDDFGVGYLGNKQYWVHLLNSWNKNENRSHRYTVEEWEELECAEDFRGCQLAEIVPDDNTYVISWPEGEQANTMLIDKAGKLVWLNNPQNKSSVPRWVNRLKNQLLDPQN